MFFHILLLKSQPSIRSYQCCWLWLQGRDQDNVGAAAILGFGTCESPAHVKIKALSANICKQASDLSFCISHAWNGHRICFARGTAYMQNSDSGEGLHLGAGAAGDLPAGVLLD